MLHLDPVPVCISHVSGMNYSVLALSADLIPFRQDPTSFMFTFGFLSYMCTLCSMFTLFLSVSQVKQMLKIV